MVAQGTNFIPDLPSGPLDKYRKLAKFDWKKMKIFFEDPDLLNIKLQVWQTLENDPVFQRPEVEPTTEEYKRRTALQLHRYCQLNFLSKEVAKLPYRKKTRYMMTANEALAVTFPDVSVKHAIGIGLFKNTLTTLGTERHQQILDATWQGKILACLALTEVAHGSNTKQMRTTATYDKTSQEFIINTPDFQAAKCWVGNLGKTCTVALLFAQLYTEGQCHGLHAFIVPIRDQKTLLPYPGIIVGDIGEKIGLHGIDNGFIMFQNYRIPREFLLNRTADVTPDGQYESSFSEPGKILGAALENLSTGRVGIMQESVNNLINAVTIAVRYAAIRQQFSVKNGNGDGDESPLIEYQLHQWRLFPYVSAAAVLKIFVASFTDQYLSVVEKSTSSTKLEDLTKAVAEIHAIVASAKPLITWTCRDAVQECREACGGHGFLKSARLGDLRAANDPCVTYEGDNNVLVQQTSNWLLRQWVQVVDHGEPASSPLGTCLFFENYANILTHKYEDEKWNYSLALKCFEWLIVYLVQQTKAKQTQLVKSGKCQSEARNETQVYKAAVLSRIYAEYNALKHYFNALSKADFSFQAILNDLGLLYALYSLDKALVYFYEGGFASTPNFSKNIKEEILKLCGGLKESILGVVDALAPPDYVLNSVLGKSDGRLYENLQTAFFYNPNAMSRPNWWQEIIIPNAPDIRTLIKSKL